VLDSAGIDDRQEPAMTLVPPRTDRARARRELVLVWSTGALLAACLGLAVALSRGEQFWLVFGVFTACFLAPSVGLAWLTVGAGRRIEVDPRAEENVETRWAEKAASGALFDLLVAVGLLLGAMSLVGLEVASDVVLMGMWAFALADGALRYALIRRRES
jgi:hypothetical protein